MGLNSINAWFLLSVVTVNVFITAKSRAALQADYNKNAS